MRFSATFLALVSAANGLAVFGAEKVLAADEGVAIPGESPLEHCSAAYQDDVVTITRVDLSPNPPEA